MHYIHNKTLLASYIDLVTTLSFHKRYTKLTTFHIRDAKNMIPKLLDGCVTQCVIPMFLVCIMIFYPKLTILYS